MARRAKRHGGDASGFQEKRLRFCRRERKRERRQGSWSLQPSTPLIDFWNVFSLVSVFACDDFFFAFVFLFSDSVCLVSVLMGATNVGFIEGGVWSQEWAHPCF